MSEGPVSTVPSPRSLAPARSAPLSPRVSFVIPLYNCLPLTQAMLASLLATLPAGLPHEIIFIDDGSTDGTREWLKSLGRSNGPAAPNGPIYHVLLNDRNAGYANANNRAAAIARGEFLALLNNDLVLQPGWLEPMLAAHRALRERAGLIGNVQRDVRTGEVDHAGLVINITGKPVHARALPSPVSRLLKPFRPVPAVTGACVLVERALWEQLGGFDEAYLNGGEDIDLCFRARAAGRVNAVALRSVVGHHVSSSPGRKARDEENSYRLARKWRGDFIAEGAREWCRTHVVRAFVRPRSSEYRLTIGAVAFLAHLRSGPPPEAVADVAQGLAHEFYRWEKMFAP